MQLLRVRLFGELDLRRGDEALPPPESARAGSLLAYLILHRTVAVPRERLAFVLWPDSAEAQARTNLRQVLHKLRGALPDPDNYLDVTQRTLQWRADAPAWVDVVAFDEALAAGDEAAAADIYTGDLLEGSYDEWLTAERDRYSRSYLEALGRLASRAEAGDPEAALEYAQRIIARDPLEESAYQLLIRIHAGRGDRVRALRAYHACVAALDDALGIPPSAATEAAYQALLAQDRAGRPQDGTASAAAEGPPGLRLVGRAHERSRLAALWGATQAGRTQLVLVTGEPGVGKTRLIEDFRTWCAHGGAAWALARSYPAEGALANGPIVSWLRSPAVKTRIARLDRSRLIELSRLLPELLDAIPGPADPMRLPAGDQRQRLFDAVADTLLAAGRPVLLIADDIQWWDRESLQLLHFLLRSKPAAEVMVAATCRVEEVDEHSALAALVAGLRRLDLVTELPLREFSRAETAALAESVRPGPLTEAEKDELHRETEGNPLFIIEALRAGNMGIASPTVSPKVHAVIASRLAALSEPAQRLVRTAAVIGREFSTDVLAEAGQVDDETLVRGLDELWRRRIIREQGADSYDFSHDKIREVAYAAMSPAQRRQGHLRIAAALERLNQTRIAPVSGLIARHFEAAGAHREAISWYAQAAGFSREIFADAEATRFLGRALDVLPSLPESGERDGVELDLRTQLLTPLGSLEGFSSSDLSADHARAVVLSRRLGVQLSAPLLWSLSMTRLSAGDFAEAGEFGRQLLALGERSDDNVLIVQGNYLLGVSAFWRADLEVARRHLEAAVREYRPEHRRTHVVRYLFDPKVVCLSRLGNTNWFLGEPDRAVRARDEALALATEIGHQPSLGTALVFASILAADMHDAELLREYSQRLNQSLDKQLRATHVVAAVLDGLIEIMDGRSAAGLERMRREIDEAIAAGNHAPGMRAGLYRLMLEGCLLAQDARVGLATADRALADEAGIELWAPWIRGVRATFAAAITPAERSGNGAPAS